MTEVVAISPDDAYSFVRGMQFAHGKSPVGWRRLAWWRFVVVGVEYGATAAITIRELRWSWLRWKWTAP